MGDLEPLNKNDDEDENAVFLASLSPNGEWLWAEAFTSQYQLSVADLLVTSNDEIHITFAHRGDIAKLETRLVEVKSWMNRICFATDLYGNLLIGTLLSSESLREAASSAKTMSETPTLRWITFRMSSLADHELLGSTVSRVAVAQYDVNGWLWANSTGGDGDSTVKKHTWPVPAGWGLGIVGDYLPTSRWAIMNPVSTWVDFYEAHVSSHGDWVFAQDTEETG